MGMCPAPALVRSMRGGRQLFGVWGRGPAREHPLGCLTRTEIARACDAVLTYLRAIFLAGMAGVNDLGPRYGTHYLSLWLGLSYDKYYSNKPYVLATFCMVSTQHF